MLHTFELKHKTTTRLVRELEVELGQSLIHPTSNTVELLTPLYTPGIRKIKVTNSRLGSYYITLEIEPQALLTKRLTVDLYTCTSMNNEALVSSLNKHIKDFYEGLPALHDEWYIMLCRFIRITHKRLYSLPRSQRLLIITKTRLRSREACISSQKVYDTIFMISMTT